MANLRAFTYASRELAEQHHLSLIDLAASEALHTDVSQEVIYQQKVAEAKAGGGDLLSAEAALLDKPLSELMDSVLSQHAERNRRITDIELKRIKAKADVRSATNAAVMHRIFNEFKGAL